MRHLRPPVDADDLLSPAELDRYAWQLGVTDLGVTGQRRLKQASVLVSRIGGVGGTAALYLAVVGVGRLVLAHAGPVRRDDLNRQVLMSTPELGRPRIEVAAERLAALNPHVVVETVGENVSEANASRLVAGVVGALAAVEVVRILAGAAPAAAGRLVVLDVTTLACRQVEIAARSGCRVCGTRAEGMAAAGDTPPP